MEKFIVWQDGKKNEAIEVEAQNMNDALDEFAKSRGYVDQADMAQELNLDGHPFNVIAAESVGEREFYGV